MYNICDIQIFSGKNAISLNFLNFSISQFLIFACFESGFHPMKTKYNKLCQKMTMIWYIVLKKSVYLPRNPEKDRCNLIICNMMTRNSIYTSEFLMNIGCPGASCGMDYRIILFPRPSSTSYKEDEDEDDDEDDDFENDEFFYDDDDDDELI